MAVITFMKKLLPALCDHLEAISPFFQVSQFISITGINIIITFLADPLQELILEFSFALFMPYSNQTADLYV